MNIKTRSRSFYSPYQVFLKKNYEMLDANDAIVENLGIKTSALITDEEELAELEYSFGVCVHNSKDWICAFDNLSYGLMMLHTFREEMGILKSLAQKYEEVLAIGWWCEASDGFSLKYYNKGHLKRSIYLDKTNMSTCKLEGFGKKMLGEPEMLNFSKVEDCILSICSNLGIKTEYENISGEFYEFEDFLNNLMELSTQ